MDIPQYVHTHTSETPIKEIHGEWVPTVHSIKCSILLLALVLYIRLFRHFAFCFGTLLIPNLVVPILYYTDDGK
jgi:hypothetical protein